MRNLVKVDFFAKTLLTNTRVLMSDVRKTFDAESQHKLKVLIVVRRSTRSFEGETERALIEHIKGLHEDFDVEVYSGIENATHTIKMFYSARVVIMFHGAAAANLVFCEDNTTVLGISCFADLEGINKWRSNAQLLRSLKPNITLGVLYVPLQVAYPHLNATVMAATSNADKLIKDQSGVHLSAPELQTVGKFIMESVFEFNSSRPSNVIEIL